LKQNPGEAAHEEVRRNVEKLLADEVFLAAECGPKAALGIHTLYRDKTGFNVLVHVYEKGKSGPPDDHGASWTVYGQATEWMDMTLWDRITDQRGRKNLDADHHRAEWPVLCPGGGPGLAATMRARLDRPGV
jgi:hypothetical protein